MHISNWVPPDMPGDDDPNGPGDGVLAFLLALTVALTISVTVVLAGGYAVGRLACAASVTALPC